MYIYQGLKGWNYSLKLCYISWNNKFYKLVSLTIFIVILTYFNPLDMAIYSLDIQMMFGSCSGCVLFVWDKIHNCWCCLANHLKNKKSLYVAGYIYAFKHKTRLITLRYVLDYLFIYTMQTNKYTDICG